LTGQNQTHTSFSPIDQEIATNQIPNFPHKIRRNHHDRYLSNSHDRIFAVNYVGVTNRDEQTKLPTLLPRNKHFNLLLRPQANMARTKQFAPKQPRRSARLTTKTRDTPISQYRIFQLKN
jgi:hypothetical protein